MNAQIKAELISIGAIDIDTTLLGRLTVPTAGPGAGARLFSSVLAGAVCGLWWMRVPRFARLWIMAR